MYAGELIKKLEALKAEHGDLPVVIRPENVQARPLDSIEFDGWCRYWGGTGPTGGVTLIRGKVFLVK